MTKQKARCFGQDIMRGEWKVRGGNKMKDKMNYRKEADKKSNIQKSPKKPEWATGTGTENMAAGTSIFDPVLCELIYRWFCLEGGKILDPFAGGSVRGIIAGYLGYNYTGIELRPEQVEANKLQDICKDKKPIWIIGDSQNIDTLAKDEYDLIFSCPPYYDLEVYSDLEGELSAKSTYQDFIKSYRKIIGKCVNMLKEDRFACFVVGDIRDKDGYYRNFVSDTISAFIDSGMQLYNEAILITAVGSLPIRVGRAFGSYRKLGKTHQNVLIFYKGDIKKIKENYKEIEIIDLDYTDKKAVKINERDT